METKQLTRFAGFLVCTASLVGLAACSSDTNYDFDASTAQFESELEEAAAQSAPVALFDPDPTAPVLPFPNSLLFLGSQDGSLNIPTSNPDPDSTGPTVALNQMDGFSTISPIVTTVSRELDPSSLIIGQTVRVFEVPVANAIAVAGPPVEELDPTRMAINQSGDQLALIPVQPLKSNTSYLVALTSGITDRDGRPLEPSFIYSLLRGAAALTGESVAELEPLRQATNSHLQVLNPALAEGEEVVLSWIFKTQSINEPLQAVKDISTASPVMLASTGLNTSQVIPGSPGFADLWVGELNVPYYLTALSDTNTPRDVLNSFWTNSDENPVGWIGTTGTQDFTPTTETTETIPVLLSVPNASAGAAGSQMPPTGWPVTVFVHGFTGDRSNMLGVADAMAAAGRAVIAIDMPLHGIVDQTSPLYVSPDENGAGPRERTFDMDVDEDGVTDASGTHFNNLANLANTRDNLRQSVADLFVLRASLAFEAQNGLLLDTNNVTFLGHSYGAIAGITTLAFDSASYRAATLAMPGGGIAQLLANSQTFAPPINAALAVEGLAIGSAEYNEFFLAAQTLIDSADPVNHAATLATNLPIHLIEVIGDTVIPNAVATAPLSGTAPLTRLLGLAQIDASSGPVAGGFVRFLGETANHGSMVNPANSQAATSEMQSQAVGFAASGGTALQVGNSELVEAAQ